MKVETISVFYSGARVLSDNFTWIKGCERYREEAMDGIKVEQPAGFLAIIQASTIFSE